MFIIYLTTIIIPVLSERSEVPMEAYLVQKRASSEADSVGLDNVPVTSDVLCEIATQLCVISGDKGSPDTMN